MNDPDTNKTKSSLSNENSPLLHSKLEEKDNSSLLMKAAKKIDGGALDYSWRAYLTAFVGNAGFGYLNYKACTTFLFYAKEGAKYLPFYGAWNLMSAGPMAFAVNFALNQFFMLYTLKALYDLYKEYELNQSIEEDSTLKWKLFGKLVLTLMVASLASYVFVALGEKLGSMEINVDNFIVMLVMNWVGSSKSWEFPGKVVDLAKQLWLMLNNLPKVKEELAYFWKTEILFEKPDAPLSTEKSDKISEFNITLSNAQKTAIDNNQKFSAVTCAEKIENSNQNTAIQTPQLSWKNSLSRQWLLYGALLVGQFSMAIANYGLLRTTIDSMSHLHIHNIVGKSIVGTLATIPFIVLSIDLANSGTSSMFEMVEWGWQKMLLLYEYYRKPKANDLTLDLQADNSDKPKFTWRNGMQIGLSVLVFIGILAGYHAAGQSSGTGLEINQEYGLNDSWARMFNIFAHIIFNGEGIKEILLAILGLAMSYLISKPSERTWTWNKDNLTGTSLFSTRAENFETYVKKNAATMLSAA